MYGVTKRDHRCTELDMIGGWTPAKGFDPSVSLYLTGQSLMDFTGDILVVSVVSCFPYFVLSKDQNGTLIPKYGTDLTMLNALASTMNFRYVIKTPLDGEWGIQLSNQTWSGMIGMVQRKEADLSVDGIVITSDRKEVVDFSIPYAYESVSFVTKAPTAKRRALAIIKPFSWQVWLGVSLSLVLATTFLTLTSNLMEEWYPANPWIAALWYMWGCLVAQGGKIPLKKVYSVRVFLAGWWLFAVVFIALYAGTLTSYMTVLTKEQPIDTVNALKKEVSQGRYSCGSLKGTFLEEKLLNPKDPVYGAIGESTQKDPSNTVQSDSFGLMKTLNSKYAYINVQGQLEFQAAKMGEENFVFSRDSFSRIILGIALRKRCPYKESFDKL
ncbi:glutamate receptor ionotropic, delta-1-like [Limulus polyphemus]|uniref:Glutamate receptor ionotropic, delta-1-like n=1 Tax=Limulus polyphemus TaxID=6850 RepID=A0ABM1BYR9_LIMPO|nr:glutamate receptor ionotropic, delta-1-like [Limulus polyphemus]